MTPGLAKRLAKLRRKQQALRAQARRNQGKALAELAGVCTECKRPL